jgi:hypothetical protein
MKPDPKPGYRAMPLSAPSPRAPAIGAVLAILTVIACDGVPTGTDTTLSGSFELTAVEGGPLPAEMWSDQRAVGALHADWLEFRPDGTVTRRYHFVVTEHHSDDAEVIEATHEMEYRRRGRSVEIGRFDPCPPNAFCRPNDTGRIRSGRLELESSQWLLRNRSALTYLRP